MLIYFISVYFSLLMAFSSHAAEDDKCEIELPKQGCKVLPQRRKVVFAEENRDVLESRIETLERARRGDQISHTLQAQEIRRLLLVVEENGKTITRLSQTLDFKNDFIGRLQRKNQEQQKIIDELTSRSTIVEQPL